LAGWGAGKVVEGLDLQVGLGRIMGDMKIFLTAMMLGAGWAGGGLAAVVEKAVDYQAGAVMCEGFHAYDDSQTGRRPAVLIVHQWTGLSDYEKMRARMLAELGYNVFALDVYGKGVRPPGPPASAQEAGKYKADRALYRERLKAGLAVLLGDERTDVTKVSAIGYCFGGMGALELARSGAKVAGVVSFHGGLDSPAPEDAKTILAEVLVLHGDADPFVPQADVAAFEKEMQAAKVSYHLVRYPEVVHAFTQKMAGDDPSKGAAYDAQADAASWVEMRKFFDRLFQ
jgi:dienelactone hydrolase